VKARRLTRVQVLLLVGILLAGLSVVAVRTWTRPGAAGPDPVLVGAGDIADCASPGDEATAALVAELPDATVVTTGDNVYPSGTEQDFAECYEPTWGAHKERTRPTPGNHEYRTADAAGYFAYFGAAAGKAGEGYYSYDLGGWHLIALNSNCSAVGGCGPSSPQGQWLREDLAAHPGDCTLAYWHHPRFSSGSHGNVKAVRPLWQALYAAGADVVLSGHDHVYESFEPQDPDGIADDSGIRQFTIGTGGAERDVFEVVQANSRVRTTGTPGVFTMTLRDTGYDWEFLPAEGAGGFTDSGSAECVDPPRRPGNLVRNPGFEADADGDARPDDWTTDSRFTRDAAAVRGGEHGGRHRAPATSPGTYAVAQDLEGLRPGATYDFAAWIDVPTSTQVGFEWDVVWRTADGAVISQTSIWSSPGTGSWREARGAVVVPAGTATAELRMVLTGLSGTVHVDDVSLVRR
jgi:Calcineurin-like phosphoesterase